jgi:hypothetical protein
MTAVGVVDHKEDRIALVCVASRYR